MKEPTSGTGLNATSASLLGLLSIPDWPRPWTTYELAKQARRSLHWVWPRAERQLYSVPKKLVALGYATAHEHATGRRASTRYRITAAGRAALREWLGEAGAPVRLEASDIVRVFLADQGDTGQLRRTLSTIADSVVADRRELAEITAGMELPAGSSREAVNALTIRLIADVHDAVESWATWALEQTSAWDSPRSPWPQAQEIFQHVIAAAATPAAAVTERAGVTEPEAPAKPAKGDASA